MKTHESHPPVRENQPSIVKRLGLGAFSISLLVHGLFAVIAVLFLYKWVYPPPEATVVPPGDTPRGAETSAKIKPPQRQTVPVSKSGPRVAIPGISDYSIPDSASEMGNVAMTFPGLGAGDAAGLPGGGNAGQGVAGPAGPGIGPGAGEGFMTPFGTKTALQGSMPGRFYDFKQTRSGKPTEGYETSRYGDFTSRVSKIQDDGFRDSAFRKFFQAADTLYLTQIAVPLSNADSAPTFFNVADKVKPSGWFVHYEGEVTASRDITFRFLGTGDDYVSVFSNNRPRLIAAWPSQRTQVSGRWEPSEPIDENAATPLPGGPLVKGDWIKLRRGEKLPLDIGIGECPGGKVGFVLMVEEKGVTYRTAANGALVLPLFTTQPITQITRDRITKDFPHWEFEWENVPVFAADPAAAMSSGLR